MEERQLRALTVLAIVLLVLVAIYTLWQPDPDEPGGDPTATEAVWTVERDDVARVVITRRDDRLAFERVDGGWRIVEPVEGPADSWKVGHLLDELARIRRGVPLDGVDPEALGLGEPPVARVVLTTPDGDLVLDVGNEAPVGWKTYARTPAGAVVAVDARVTELLREEAHTWRDPRVLPVPIRVREARWVRVEGPEGTLDLARDGDAWWLRGYTRADPEAVEDLLLGLADLRFLRIEAPSPGDRIAHPVRTVTVDPGDGTELVLRVGEETPLGTVVELEGGARGHVVTDSLAFLAQGPRDVGDRHAFPRVTAEVAAISVRLGETAFRVARDEARWDELVSRLEAAPVAYVRDAPDPPEEHIGRVTYHLVDERERTVEVGEVRGEHHVLVDTAGGSPYLAPVGAIARLAGF